MRKRFDVKSCQVGWMVVPGQPIKNVSHIIDRSNEELICGNRADSKAEFIWSSNNVKDVECKICKKNYVTSQWRK